MVVVEFRPLVLVSFDCGHGCNQISSGKFIIFVVEFDCKDQRPRVSA